MPRLERARAGIKHRPLALLHVPPVLSLLPAFKIAARRRSLGADIDPVPRGHTARRTPDASDQNSTHSPPARPLGAFPKPSALGIAAAALPSASQGARLRLCQSGSLPTPLPRPSSLLPAASCAVLLQVQPQSQLAHAPWHRQGQGDKAKEAQTKNNPRNGEETAPTGCLSYRLPWNLRCRQTVQTGGPLHLLLLPRLLTQPLSRLLLSLHR